MAVGKLSCFPLFSHHIANFHFLVLAKYEFS